MIKLGAIGPIGPFWSLSRSKKGPFLNFLWKQLKRMLGMFFGMPIPNLTSKCSADVVFSQKKSEYWTLISEKMAHFWEEKFLETGAKGIWALGILIPNLMSNSRAHMIFCQKVGILNPNGPKKWTIFKNDDLGNRCKGHSAWFWLIWFRIRCQNDPLLLFLFIRTYTLPIHSNWNGFRCVGS